MISYLYFVCLILSIFVLIYVAAKEVVNTDRFSWTILILLPIIITGYWIKSFVHTEEGAMIAFCFIYIESTVLLVIAEFAMLNSLNIKFNKWVKIGAYMVAGVHFLSICASKDSHLYYNSITIDENFWGSATLIVDGPFKITHYVFLGLIVVAAVFTIIIGFTKKGTFSRRIFHSYSMLLCSGMIIYVIESLTKMSFSILPVLYVIAGFITLANYDHLNEHDIRKLIDFQIEENNVQGYIAFDNRNRFLGYTAPMLNFSKDIENFIIDAKIPSKYSDLAELHNRLIKDFEESDISSVKIEKDDKVFQFHISYFHIGNSDKNKGYIISCVDITEETKQLEFIQTYNKTLGEEIDKKTSQVVEIQNKVVLGLADMVENRDDSTGGHIKRTSDVIKIVLEEAMKQGFEGLDSKKVTDIVRAAPMHDLGKMSIDNSILCKPGRLTPEEFDIMKSHSTKSGEIVKLILGGVEEEQFVDVAYKVARYHHERWDGRGYPEGLLGENIPLEARFLSVVDVYDALVSKRCYKEAMSFEQANKIMMECMGSQFDPAMRPIFVAARSKLEDYYSKI